MTVIGARRLLTALVVLALGPQPMATAVDFLRVYVPRSRLDEVPLGASRHVPLPVEEFDALVARAAAARVGRTTAAPRPTPRALRADYVLRVADDGELVGTVICTVPPETAAAASALPLGGLLPRPHPLDTERPDAVDEAGVVPPPDAGPGIVFGTASDGLFVRTSTAGTFWLDIVCPPEASGAAAYRLPLLPALESRIDLRLPADAMPVLSGPAARAAVIAPPGTMGPSTSWRIDLGPADVIDIGIAARDRAATAVRTFSSMTIRGRDAALAVAVVPDGVWRSGSVVFDKQPTVVVTGVELASAADHPDVDDRPGISWQESTDGRELVVSVPPALEGQRLPLVLRAVAPAIGTTWRLPLVALPPSRWTGGGLRVQLDPALVASGVELTDAQVVSPEVASRWPLPPTGAADAPRAPVFHLEPQGPGAAVELTVRPRVPTFDVARVTTVEISAGAVLGRAACDIRVVDGEAFEIVGTVAAGWIIDSVEPLALADADGRRVIVDDPVPLDWRTSRGPDGTTLRIGLPVAVTPRAVLGLRISGHRPRIPVGSPFNTAEIDMVRFPGEFVDSALIDFKVGPESVVEVDGEPAGWLRARGRLAPLVEEGTLRARIRGSVQASSREARVVQRRPPLDARVNVRLDARDDLLVESFTFSCQPEAGGIDALVAHFSEPMGEPLDWSVLAPDDVAIAVRRLDTPGGLTGGPRNDAIAESWLIECTPAVSRPVTIRATRTLPFVGAVPVPLAWLEGDTTPGGIVVVTAAGPRPEFISRRLQELPASADADAGPGGCSEFAYGPPAAAGDGLSAAELVPAPPPADARAWVWLERVSCWCDESGSIETESRFAIENHGRSSLMLTVPAGRTLERVLVDGAGVAIDAAEFSGASQRIPLPTAARRVDMLVRTRATHHPGLGCWRIEPLSCSIDLPVLDRDIHVLLPPGLDIAATSPAYREVGRAEPGWLRRLFGPPWAMSTEAYAPATTGGPEHTGGTPATPSGVQAGFHARRFVVAASRAPGSGILLVRRRLLGSLVILAASAAASGAAWCLSRRPRLAAGMCIGTGVAALWATAPFDVVARVALWAAVAGVAGAATGSWIAGWAHWVVRLGRRAARGTSGLWLVVVVAASAEAAEPLRVVITEGAQGSIALVPEELYRLLADAAPPDAVGIRILGCHVQVAEPPAAMGWRLTLDLETDMGGTLVLDQAPSRAVWQPPAAGSLPPGIRAVIDGPRLRIASAVAGRLELSIGIVPSVVPRGGIVTAAIDIPAAPRSLVSIVDESGQPIDPRLSDMQCDRASATGPWMAAALVRRGVEGAVFDLSGSRRLRVVRPLRQGTRLATGIPWSETTNDVVWGTDSARVEATIEIDAGLEILRSFVVRGDARFTAVDAVPNGTDIPQLTPIAADRLLVELPNPQPGRIQVRLTGIMPVADPAGVFVLPGLWPEAPPQTAGANVPRVVRLSTAAELEATLDPPPGGPTAAGSPPERVIVRRRPQQPRGNQTLVVDMAGDRTLLRLRTQIDATAMALTRIPVDIPAGSIVDRVALVRDDPSATGDGQSVDLSWSRTDGESVLVVVQQPRPGRFRLDIELRLADPPPRRGRLPLARARLREGAPLLVTWQAAPGARLVVTPAGTDPATVRRTESLSSMELFQGTREPEYLLQFTDREPTAPVVQPPLDAPPRAADIESRLERTEVFLSLDARGRARGLVRFDLLTGQPVIRVRLPSGMRLFDALVDGREVAAVPRDSGTWDIRLQDVAWPRSLLVMFAGELPPGFSDGAPVRVETPTIDALPGGPVWWTVQQPPGFALRIAAPVRPLETAALEARRASVRQRLDAIFDRAIAADTTPERERLQTLATLRRVGASLPAEAAWEESILGTRADGRPRAETFESDADDGGLTLRAMRDFDPTAAGRALATATLLLAGGALWIAGRRGKPGG